MTQLCEGTEQEAQASASTEARLPREEQHGKGALSEDSTEMQVSRRQSTEKEPEIKESQTSSSEMLSSLHNEVRPRCRL